MRTRTLIPLRLTRFILALTCALALSAPVLAQNGPVPPAAAAAESTGTPADTGAPGNAASELLLRDLVVVLRDDVAREAFLAGLEEALATDGATASAGDSATAGPEDASTSLGVQISGALAGATSGAIESLVYLTTLLSNVPSRLAALNPSQVGVLVQTLVDVFILIIVTYAVLLGFQILLRWLRALARQRAEKFGPVGKFLLAGAILVGGALVVFAATILGVVAAAVLAGGEAVGLRQDAYLQAFLTVEMLMVTAQAILMPAMPWARLLPLADSIAKSLHRHLRVLVIWLGYGLLLVVPSFNETISYNTGRALTVVIDLVALVYVFWVVLRHRRSVAQILASGPQAVEPSGLRRFIAHFWHWPVLIWLAVTIVVVLTRPVFIIDRYLDASLTVALTIIAGLLVMGAASRFLATGIPLPAGLTSRLPALERHVNAVVPHILGIIRVCVLLGIAAYTLTRFELVDLGALFNTPLGARIFDAVISILFVLGVSFLAWVLIEAWIDFRLNTRSRVTPTAREKTLLALFRNAAIVTLVAVTVMFALSELGINIAPLLASAGVVGLAIGFGAQKLVQDVITGIFIQLEGAIDVGDVVTVGGTSGVVERLTIRSVALRDLQGVYHIVPFSSVDMVSNFMRGFAYVVSEIGVAYRENVDVAKQAILDAFEELKKIPEIQANILEDQLEWMGLDRFGASEVVLRSRIKTLPGKQWETGRAFNAEIKKIFDARDIEIPFPHHTVYFGVDKKGDAPPMHVVRDEQDEESKNKPAARRKAAAKPAAARPAATKSPASRRTRRKPRYGPESPDND